MDTTKAEVRLTFDPTKTDKVSVKLRIIYQRDSRRYALPIKDGVFLSKDDFDKLVKCHSGNYGKSAERIRNLYDQIAPYLKKAKVTIEKLPVFSFSAFKDEFYRSAHEEVGSLDQKDLLQALTRKAEAMNRQGRVGNASGYELAGKSLARYLISLTKDDRKELNLPSLPRKIENPVLTLIYEQVTPALLADYEAWMLTYGKSPRSPTGKPGPASPTTVGIYLRHVRAVFNDAIEAGTITNAVYPFGKKKYVIPAGRNKKKALSRESIDLLKVYQPEPNSFEQRSFDLFFFSYYCNGMNITDIANLRWKNLDLKAGTFSFIRGKTQRTKKENQQPINGRLRPETMATIERWSEGRRLPDDYVFPFLEPGIGPKRERELIRQLIKVTNKYMRLIAEKLGIDSDITSYWARHSFTTSLLRSEVPLGFISQALGHSDIKTTQAYLGSFDDEQTRKYLDNL